MGDRTGHEDERKQEQCERDEPLPDAVPGGRNLGEHRHVRERDRVASAPPRREQRQQRDRWNDQKDKQPERVDKTHEAHLTPTCTSAPKPRGIVSLTLTCTWALRTPSFVWTMIAFPNPEAGGFVAPDAVELQLSTSDSPVGQESVIVRWKPGVTAIVRAT
jgi:hypothetical protein